MYEEDSVGDISGWRVIQKGTVNQNTTTFIPFPNLNGWGDEEYLLKMKIVSPTISGNQIRLAINYGYYDDFEDGKVTDRDEPYLDWTSDSGELVISGVGVNNGYSLRHTGNGVVTWGNRVRKPITYPRGTTKTIQFNFKLTSAGTADAACPYVYLWILDWQDSSNFLVLRTTYANPNQVLSLHKMENGVATTIGSATWLAGAKLGTATTYTFSIVDTGSHITVYVDWVSKLSLDYTFNPTGTCISEGLGCTADTQAKWDNILIYNQSVTSFYDLITNNSSIYFYGELKMHSTTVPFYPLFRLSGVSYINSVVSATDVVGRYAPGSNIVNMMLYSPLQYIFGDYTLYKKTEEIEDVL